MPLVAQWQGMEGNPTQPPEFALRRSGTQVGRRLREGRTPKRPKGKGREKGNNDVIQPEEREIRDVADVGVLKGKGRGCTCMCVDVKC